MNQPILTLRGVRKKRGSLILLDTVDLSLSQGTVTALLGPANSGKSTLLRLAAGLIPPSEGEIKVLGGSPAASIARASVAYLPAASVLPGHLTVKELIALYASMFTDFDREQAQCRIDELRVKTDKRLSSMSRTTREKVQLILTLSRRARLYLLDSPVTGTPAAKEFTLRLIREAVREDAAVLIAAKDPSDIEGLADTFLVLSEGKVILSGRTDTYFEENGVTLAEGYGGLFSC